MKHSLCSYEAKRVSSIHDNTLFHRMQSCFIFRAPTVRFISKTKSTPYEVLFVLEASPRLELGVRILQTLALPLGYDALFNWIRAGLVDDYVIHGSLMERETGFGPATFTLAR